MPDSDADGSAASSRWWLVVAAMPVVTAVELVLGSLLVGTVLGTAGSVDPLALLVPAAPFLAAALVVRLLLPVALLADAGAIREADVGWRPSSLWPLGALVGVLVPLFDAALAVLYLRRRRRALGAP